MSETLSQNEKFAAEPACDSCGGPFMIGYLLGAAIIAGAAVLFGAHRPKPPPADIVETYRAGDFVPLHLAAASNAVLRFGRDAVAVKHDGVWTVRPAWNDQPLSPDAFDAELDHFYGLGWCYAQRLLIEISPIDRDKPSHIVGMSYPDRGPVRIECSPASAKAAY